MDDTIFALSSGAPPAAIAVVRISGSDLACRQVAQRVAGVCLWAIWRKGTQVIPKQIEVRLSEADRRTLASQELRQALTASSVEALRGGVRAAAAEGLGRIGDDQDLKGAALLFVSDAGKHITGQILAIDGGATATSADFIPDDM